MNTGLVAATVQVENVYAGEISEYSVASGASFSTVVSVSKYSGWYDLILTVENDDTFQQEIAGHLETGKASTTDPAIG
jgi:phospholipase C